MSRHPVGFSHAGLYPSSRHLSSSLFETEQPPDPLHTRRNIDPLSILSSANTHNMFGLPHVPTPYSFPKTATVLYAMVLRGRVGVWPGYPSRCKPPWLLTCMKVQGYVSLDQHSSRRKAPSIVGRFNAAMRHSSPTASVGMREYPSSLQPAMHRKFLPWKSRLSHSGRFCTSPGDRGELAAGKRCRNGSERSVDRNRCCRIQFGLPDAGDNGTGIMPVLAGRKPYARAWLRMNPGTTRDSVGYR
jgi:hypothetical protein